MNIIWEPGRNLRPVESGANADLYDWMGVDGWDAYVAEKCGRAKYPATWGKARAGLLKCASYIHQTNIQRLCKAHGVGAKIASLLENSAPWDAFNPRATETKHIEKPLRIQPIKSLWRERIFKEHGVDKFDKVAQSQLIEELTDH